MLRKKSILLLAVLLVSIFVCPFSPAQAADEQIRVFLDDTQLKFDFYPITRNDRVLVGMKPVFDAFGADCEWTPELRKITAHKGTTMMEFYIDNQTYWIDSVSYTADVAPLAYAGHTYVPLGLIAKCFKSDAFWNTDSCTVFMFSENYQPPTNAWGEAELNNDREHANSIYLDRTALPTFSGQGDVDYFKLWVHKDGNVVITVKGHNENQLPVFKLYNEMSTTPLATSAKDAQGVESVSLRLQPGIYYVAVSNQATIVTSDYYTLLAASAR